MNVQEMSDKDLRDLLLTCDYKGKEIKEQALDELLKRAQDNGVRLNALMSLGADVS